MAFLWNYYATIYDTKSVNLSFTISALILFCTCTHAAAQAHSWYLMQHCPCLTQMENTIHSARNIQRRSVLATETSTHKSIKTLGVMVTAVEMDTDNTCCCQLDGFESKSP